MKIRHAAALAALLIASNSFAFTGEKYLSQAKVSLDQARTLALKAYPGKIVAEELEQESGGSGLRYSFVVSHRHAKHEVGIDAKTGDVLENSVESGHPD
ncbi:MAG: PepSY domain-containing protein [Candidatus Binataceae bacterium]|nr:PepSY domain-containing protein [Candidatus Binataceae bacterium]